jgi:hypothetical protein
MGRFICNVAVLVIATVIANRVIRYLDEKEVE